MELILWRHADAEEGEPDLTRNLTSKGNRQARRMARWLHGFLPKHVRILCSPANRARQTAEALRLPVEISEELAPGCTVQQLLKASGWPLGDDVVLLVGHNPAISELASLLLSTRTFPMSLRRGSVLWLSSRTREGEPGVVIKAAMVPSMLKGG
jgi:phosphohistidine phosphatase